MAQKTNILDLNPHEVIRCLNGILSPKELNKIQQEMDKHVRDLIKLGEEHLNFAKQNHKNWRQAVSRAYYSCYMASRAVRYELLMKSEEFLIESKQYAKTKGSGK